MAPELCLRPVGLNLRIVSRGAEAFTTASTLWQDLGRRVSARGAPARLRKACHGSEASITLGDDRARDACHGHRLLSRAGSAEPAAVTSPAERLDVGRARG